MDNQEKYIIVVETYDKQLVKVVNEKIKQGYEPYGNLTIAFNEAGVIKSFIQMMTLQKSGVKATDNQEKYIVVVEQYDKQIIKAIHERVKQGYEPYGNLVIAFSETGVVKAFIQVMLLQKRTRE